VGFEFGPGLAGSLNFQRTTGSDSLNISEWKNRYFWFFEKGLENRRFWLFQRPQRTPGFKERTAVLRLF
jgi:hypothetical protein